MMSSGRTNEAQAESEGFEMHVWFDAEAVLTWSKSRDKKGSHILSQSGDNWQGRCFIESQRHENLCDDPSASHCRPITMMILIMLCFVHTFDFTRNFTTFSFGKRPLPESRPSKNPLEREFRTTQRDVFSQRQTLGIKLLSSFDN
jgi:hypothetical protein